MLFVRCLALAEKNAFRSHFQRLKKNAAKALKAVFQIAKPISVSLWTGFVVQGL
jgi:hypothetical protein